MSWTSQWQGILWCTSKSVVDLLCFEGTPFDHSERQDPKMYQETGLFNRFLILSARSRKRGNDLTKPLFEISA
jgi:hypothetical protein